MKKKQPMSVNQASVIRFTCSRNKVIKSDSY